MMGPGYGVNSLAGGPASPDAAGERVKEALRARVPTT